MHAVHGRTTPLEEPGWRLRTSCQAVLRIRCTSSPFQPCRISLMLCFPSCSCFPYFVSHYWVVGSELRSRYLATACPAESARPGGKPGITLNPRVLVT